MSKKQYTWLTNVALILGVVSAFVYQRAYVPHATAIALAIVAGVLSVGVYFHNQFACRGTSKVKSSADFDLIAVGTGGKHFLAEAKGIEVKPREGRKLVLLGFEEAVKLAEMQAAMQRTVVDRIRGLSLLIEAQREAELEKTAQYMQQYLQQNNAARRLRYGFHGDNGLIAPEVELSPREAAACYAQIMREIVTEGSMKEWEFRVDRKGGLRVSGRRYEQEDEDQDQSEHVDVHWVIQEARAELEGRHFSDSDFREQRA